MKMMKIAAAVLMMLAIALPCTLVNVSVEPAVTQFYTAGFTITFADINTSNYQKDIDIFVLRSEDSIPIKEIYQDANSQQQFVIPDTGNTTSGFFYVDQNLVLGKSYLLWVQTCGGSMSAPFEVVNQYTLADQVGSVIVWLKNNIFILIIVTLIFALAVLIARPIIQR